MLKSTCFVLPLVIGALALTACLPVQAPAPIGLQATNVSDTIYALQGTQAALNYMATQTPHAATQSALGTQSAVEGQIQGTKSALDAQATALAMQIFADSATATQVAVATQNAYSLQATARADEMTQTAFYANATATQDTRNATATQAQFDYERQAQVNGAIAWTPFIVSGVFLLFIWRFVIIYEDRKSIFNTPGGEPIFTRKTSLPKAIMRALVRRIIPEIHYEDFAMPTRAVGHALTDTGGGYHVEKDRDARGQYELIMLEQMRARGLPLPGPALGSIPQLSAYSGLLGEAGEIETVSPVDPEVVTWINDVEDQE